MVSICRQGHLNIRQINRWPARMHQIALAGALFLGVPLTAQAQVTPAAVGAMSVGTLITSLQSLASSLTQDASALLQQGNSDLAQQQALAASALSALANQLSDIYKGRLNDTVRSINVTEQNLATDAANLLSQGQAIEKATALDAHNIIYQMQGAANQVLRALPFASHVPVFYGMQVYDVASAFPQKGFDLELLGFNLTDSALKFKAPQIVVGGIAVPAANVSVQQDRVQVVLPQPIKDKIGFRSNACLPPAPFTATMTVFYKATKRVLLVPFGHETQTPFTAFSLPGPDAVAAKVAYSGTIHSANDVVQQFSAVSGQTNFGCEQTSSENVTISLNPQATQISCNAAWINTSNVKGHSQTCSANGTVAAASGNIWGIDKTCVLGVCDCHGGGHGSLLMTGSYHVSQPVASPFTDASTPPYRLVANVQQTIPTDTGRTVEQIDVTLSRPGCVKPLDTISMSISGNMAADNTQASQAGLFTADYRNERLTITRK